MNKDKTQLAFQKYVDAATDLAESVKRNIIKDGYVDDKTVNLLNNFFIATNEMANLQDELNDDINESDESKH